MQLSSNNLYNIFHGVSVWEMVTAYLLKHVEKHGQVPSYQQGWRLHTPKPDNSSFNALKTVCSQERLRDQTQWYIWDGQKKGAVKNLSTSSHKTGCLMEVRSAQLLHSLDGTKHHPFVTAGRRTVPNLNISTLTSAA